MQLQMMIERKNYEAFAKNVVFCSPKMQQTILLWIAEKGNLEPMLIMHKYNCNGWCSEIGEAAAKAGHLNIVKFLKENRPECCESSILDLAQSAGHENIVEYLEKVAEKN